MITVVEKINGKGLNGAENALSYVRKNIVNWFTDDEAKDGTWLAIAIGYTNDWSIDHKSITEIAIDESNLDYLTDKFENNPDFAVYFENYGGYYYALMRVLNDDGTETALYDKAIEIINKINDYYYLNEMMFSDKEYELQQEMFENNIVPDMLADTEDERSIQVLRDMINNSSDPSHLYESYDDIEDLFDDDWKMYDNNKWYYVGDLYPELKGYEELGLDDE